MIWMDAGHRAHGRHRARRDRRALVPRVCRMLRLTRTWSISSSSSSGSQYFTIFLSLSESMMLRSREAHGPGSGVVSMSYSRSSAHNDRKRLSMSNAARVRLTRGGGFTPSSASRQVLASLRLSAGLISRAKAEGDPVFSMSLAIRQNLLPSRHPFTPRFLGRARSMCSRSSNKRPPPALDPDAASVGGGVSRLHSRPATRRTALPDSSPNAGVMWQGTAGQQ